MACDNPDELNPSDTGLGRLPTIPPADAPDKSGERKKHWLDYATFGVGILGLVGLGIYSYLTWGIVQQNKNTVTEMQRQTRVDERPWLKFDAPSSWNTVDGKPIVFLAGQPLQIPVMFTNYGKTAARQIRADFTVQVIPSGQELDVPEEDWIITNSPDPVPGRHITAIYPSQSAVIGVVNPGETISVTIGRTKIFGRESSVDPATEDEITRLGSGRAYVGVWGEIHYMDIFGIQHETKFCRAIPRTATMIKCAQYDDVDSNDGTKPPK